MAPASVVKKGLAELWEHWGAEMDVLEKHAPCGIVNVNSRLVYQYGEAWSAYKWGRMLYKDMFYIPQLQKVHLKTENRLLLWCGHKKVLSE